MFCIQVAELRAPIKSELSDAAEEGEEEEEPPTTTTINAIKFDTRRSQEAFGHLVPKTKAQKEREKDILDTFLTQRPSVDMFQERNKVRRVRGRI